MTAFDGTQVINYIIVRPNTDVRSDEVRSVPYQTRNWKYVQNDNIFSDMDGNEIDLFDYDYIILDEAQFFKSEVIDQVKLLLAENKYVIVSGLDKDYLDNPFSEFMKWVLCTADDVTKLSAICSKCGAPSTLAKLVSLDGSIPAGNIIIEDDNHKYIPICRKCMNNESLK
jgi:thymidine kinase